MPSFNRLILALILIVGASAAFAGDFKIGDITVSQAWSRATPTGAEVAAGFMRIANAGSTPDRLIAVSSDIAGVTQVHEMSMQNGVMEMNEVKGGLEIPAGGSVELKPQSFHVMFMQLKRPLKEGETFKAELTFAKAGKVTVDLVVGGMGATTAPGS